MSTIYTESDLTIDLTDKEYFRFEALPTYKRLSGENIKEMDFTFIEDGKLYFLEVKSFEKFFKHPQKISFPEAMAELKIDLPKTLSDALLMMAAVWLETKTGNALKKEGIADSMTQVKPCILILALDLIESPEANLSVLNTAISSYLNGYLKLYDAKFILLSYKELQERFPFIKRNEASENQF